MGQNKLEWLFVKSFFSLVKYFQISSGFFRLLDLTADIRLARKNLSRVNALAYFVTVTNMKSFISQIPGGQHLNWVAPSGTA
jgi:hypothetical protein